MAVALTALNLEPEIAGVNIQRIRLIVCMVSHRSSFTDYTWCACDSSHEPLAVICALLGAMRALIQSAGVPSSSPREHERSYPTNSQQCCRCEDAAQHVQRRWPVSSEQTTRDGGLWTPTPIQRGRTCAREQTQDTTTSMGSRAMVAEQAPHHPLVFY